MAQDFDLRIEGKSIAIKSGRLIQTFDTVNDGFTVQIEINRTFNRNLYEFIKPFQAPNAQIYLDGKLMLTGKLTKTSPDKSPSGVVYNLAGWSNTFDFADSHLKPPYEYNDLTIHLLTIEVAKQTATKVLHTGPPLDTIKKATAQAGMSGAQFIAPWADKRQHVISSTPDGLILLQQADIKQKPVGTIEEDSPNSLLQKQFTASYDYRKRSRTYKVVAKKSDGPGEAVATDKNIKGPRHKFISANDQIDGALQEFAEYQKKLEVIKALEQQIPVVGWYAPDRKLWTPGTLITLVSETLFVPNGFTYFIRSVEFEIAKDTKTAVLSLIPKEIYSDQPIVEPWFE